MLLPGARILDFDGSVTGQLACGLPPPARIVDLRDVGQEARLWASGAQRDYIRQCLQPADRHRPTFIGSGDYHYVSALLLETMAEQPVTVIVFDHHPDWERLPPRYGCGAWVNRALELPGVQQVLHVGAGSADLKYPAAWTGNRAAVRAGRLRLLTAAALGREPDGRFAAALAAVPTPRVYVSVDKDCLRAAGALTNWEEGNLELEFLLRALRAIVETRTVVGLDITGDYSPIEIRSAWKSWCSRLDHPANYSARGRGAGEIARLNAETNAAILGVLPGAAGRTTVARI